MREMDARARGRGTTRRTLTPSTTFLITWRYTEAMSIGPDVLTPGQSTHLRPRACGSERETKAARECVTLQCGDTSADATVTEYPTSSEDTASM